MSSRRSAMLLYRKHYPALFVAVWSLFIFLEILYKYMLNSLRVKSGRADAIRWLCAGSSTVPGAAVKKRWVRNWPVKLWTRWKTRARP